jgi:hypothetical protein
MATTATRPSIARYVVAAIQDPRRVERRGSLRHGVDEPRRAIAAEPRRGQAPKSFVRFASRKKVRRFTGVRRLGVQGTAKSDEGDETEDDTEDANPRSPVARTTHEVFQANTGTAPRRETLPGPGPNFRHAFSSMSTTPKLSPNLRPE